MFSLPAFLSFPFNFPSLLSISLPANIQRRFLSYVLKRALGRFVKAGGLDVERIQAQISEGWVEIEALEVDTAEINTLIPPSLPLVLTSGVLSKVTARVPFPNLWSDTLSLTLDSLDLEFSLISPSPKGKAPETPNRLTGRRPPSPRHNLADSVTTAADDFLHEELDAYEEAELDRSIRQSLVLEQNDPFSRDDIPGAFPGFASSPGGPSSPLPPTVESTTVLAGLVERILARLEFKVKCARIKIRHEDGKHGGVFELRIGEVRYADETDAGEEEGSRHTVRAIKLSSIEVYMLPLSTVESPPQPRFFPSMSRSSSSSSTSSVSTPSSTGNADMYMSQAVADLRQSSTSGVGSDASVYQSALSERIAEEEPSSETASRSKSRSRSVTPTGAARTASKEVLLLSFGTEDVSFRIQTTRPQLPEAPPASSERKISIETTRTSSRPRLFRASTSFNTSSLSALDLELSIGTVAVMVLPSQAATILSALQIACQGGVHNNPSEMPSDPNEVVQARVNAKVRLKAIHLALVYDLRASDSPSLAAAAKQYWAQPRTTSVPYGHLKFRLEGLEIAYASKGYVPKSAPSRSERGLSAPSAVHGTTGSARYGPRPPTVTVDLTDATIFEYLATKAPDPRADLEDSPPGGTFPVLIFDSNLSKQYDVAPGAHSVPFAARVPSKTAQSAFPDFESVDWRNSGVQRREGTAKAWKVRQKGRGVLKGTINTSPEQEGPVVMARKELSSTASKQVDPSTDVMLRPTAVAVVDLQPVHVFFDLSLVERLLPMLRSIAPAVRSASSDKNTPLELHTPRLASANLPAEHMSHYVIDDLDAQASSLSTLTPTRLPSELLRIRCPVVRLDIRCPAPPDRRGTWGDGAHLRSGIVTLDIHGIDANVRQSSSPSQPPSAKRVHSQVSEHVNYTKSNPAVRVQWQKMMLFFCRVPAKKASAFIVIGPLAPDPNDVDDSVLLPVVEVKTQVERSTLVKTSLVTCRIPSVQANIRQSTIEGLQFFADDITHWLDGAFGDDSAPKPRDDLKMIGSRFFGSKGSSSASSSAIEDDEEDTMAATILRVIISEADIALLVPRGPTTWLSGERTLALRASDMDAKVEINTTGRQETAFSLALMDADFSDRSDAEAPSRLFGRTTPLTLTTRNQPLIQLRFSSLTDVVSETKETGIKLACSSFTLFVTSDVSWVKDLALFAKTPEGVFENVVPSEVTRISLQLNECSVHVAAPILPGAIVAVFGVVDLKTDIISDAEESLLEFGVSSSYLLAVDDLGVIGPLEPGLVALEAWKRAGFACLVEIAALDAQVLRALDGTREILLDILQCQLRVTACADSLATFAALVGDLGKIGPVKKQQNVTSPAAMQQSIDVFGSVDEDAFNRLPDVISGIDLIDDDLPTNLDYLDRSSRHSSKDIKTDQATGESLRSWQADDADSRFASEVIGETVKILFEEPFVMEEDYWENLPDVNSGYADDTRLGTPRIRLHDCNIGIFLHDGYDWQRTRKVIEDEIKAVRRRLERIRQLLASGQKADETIETARSVLFNSVYIGLDQSRDNLDSAALLAAIDEKLDELGAETASQSSWQTAFPPAGERVMAKKARVKGRRLTPSKRPQMEISLAGIRGDVDMYGPNDPTASRVHITVKSLEILDHIKSSTWKKFLTEMKADSRGNMRETDADMVRIELVAVRPSLPSLEAENRLRLKILPLRLHVDQDALDFLKRFFNFSMPAQTPAPASPTAVKKAAPNEPFFQHVEVFPIELKLDYKPKRVDFAALREGRTIELMNFFHFDGAEMTLRHITLSGITGWSRLSTTLQDNWTPDVKANQLADVISGVSPIRSMVNVGSGVADLILLPIEQYRKDGRVARGVQRGTNSFVRSTAMEMMKLGARLATGTQVILEKAEGLLGGRFGENVVAEVEGDGVREANSEDEADAQTIEVISRYANQPEDMREGVQAAYQSLSRNINSAAQTILAVPMEVYERSGDDGPLRAVVRAVPIAVLKPMIGASEAVSKTLLGMRNSLDPEGRKELVDKYK